MLHFAAAVATQLGYGFIALFIAWLAIRRSREGTLPGEPRDSLVRRFMRALFGFSGVRRPIYRPLRDAANPMLVKEMRWGWQGRRKLRMLVFGGLFAAQALLAISLWAALSNVVPTERAVIVGVYWAVFVAGIIAVVTPALLANTLTKEYERENIDALRMTLMKSGTIVWGKVWSGIAAAIPMLTAILLGGILVGILAEDLVWPWKFVTVVFVSSIATIFLVLVLSIYASMLTKRTPAAIILSYTCAWMVLFGFCWLGWYSNGSMSPDAFDAAMAFTSPAMGCGFHLLSLGPFDSEFYDDSTNFFSAFWISNVLFHVAFAIVLLLICIRAFRMSRMQDR